MSGSKEISCQINVVFGSRFEEHVMIILFSDWPILIVTYFYGIFTAKKWYFTTKSYLFRKKTIPSAAGRSRGLRPASTARWLRHTVHFHRLTSTTPPPCFIA